MNCSPDLVAASMDEELDPSQRAALEQHLAGCPECSALAARLREQKAAIRASAPYYPAPPELRQSIRAALRAEASPVQETRWRWLAIAASVLLLASLSWNLLQLRPRRAPADLAENVLSDHIRALLADHLLDVPSSDQHTVKPWFAGKLDFSPDVRDFAAQGFPLAGARVEYLEHRRVAALVYYRRKHVIDLFEWPSAESVAPVAAARDGYNILHWTSGAITYWAVSDVSAPELELFRSLAQQR